MQMSTSSETTIKTNATQLSITGWLESEKASLAKEGLWISKRAIMDRLLGRSLELQGAFTELFDGMEPMQWQAYLDVVLFTAAFWNPGETLKMRQARRRLEEINSHVDGISTELADMLAERTALCEEFSFDADDAYHICDLIDRADQRTGHYEFYLKPELDKLRSQYDLKYWPKVNDVVREIGLDAARAEVQPIMEITREAIGSRIASRRDFMRALFSALDENKGGTFRDIPETFQLTDESLAALICCALDLVDDQLVDAGYVKRVRQIEREKGDLN